MKELKPQELQQVSGAITASELSNNLYLGSAGFGAGALMAGAFGGPIGLGIAAGLGLGSLAFGGLGAISAMYSF